MTQTFNRTQVYICNRRYFGVQKGKYGDREIVVRTATLNDAVSYNNTVQQLSPAYYTMRVGPHGLSERSRDAYDETTYKTKCLSSSCMRALRLMSVTGGNTSGKLAVGLVSLPKLVKYCLLLMVVTRDRFGLQLIKLFSKWWSSIRETESFNEWRKGGIRRFRSRGCQQNSSF